jgi:chromosome segregation ATPase
LGDLRDEYHALSATVSRLEASVARLEQEFRDDQTSRQQVLREVEELRAEAVAVMERLERLEAAFRGGHDA